MCLIIETTHQKMKQTLANANKQTKNQASRASALY
jgi:hypothetical protein